MNPMSNGGVFEITYPDQVTIESSTLSTCTVTYNSVDYPMSCTDDSGSRTVTVDDGFQENVAKGDSITITIGPLTNPEI